MSDTLLLGPVQFEAFELPGQIRFGGSQRLAVHQLPGGARVIDAMGRDDAEIVWRGAFSGADAVERARLLDLLRVAGNPLSLTWDGFCYTVLIARFEADYARPNWIPYSIACIVLRDETAALIEVVASLAAAGLADLDAADAFGCGVDLSAATATLAAAGATTLGTAAYISAVTALGNASTSVDSELSSAETAIGSAVDVPSAAAATQQLAAVVAARGYIDRTAANLANAGT
jgi:hypothetical protein